MKTNQATSEKQNFILVSRNRVAGTTIVEAGFDTAREALNAFDAMDTAFRGFGGVRVCRKCPATGVLLPWTEWL